MALAALLLPVAAWSFVLPTRGLGAHGAFGRRVVTKLSESESSEEDKDWRDLRAQLVALEAPLLSLGQEQGEDELEGPWVHESPLIEQGSVLLGSVQRDVGFGLHQQYFHKSVIFITEHDRNFTKGIIINRPTVHFNNEEGSLREDGEWRVFWGGDVRGPQTDYPEVICLHKLASNASDEVSVGVVRGVKMCTLSDARTLIQREEATPKDFWLFKGYAGWGAGQLQGELDRDTWYMAAADGDLVFDKLIQQEADLADRGKTTYEAGVSVWNQLMEGIGRSPDIDFTSGFDDVMLEEWHRVNLGSPRPPATPSQLMRAPKPTKPIKVEKGQVLRASATDFILTQQYLHKSLVVVLAGNSQVTLGIVLNRQTTSKVEFKATGQSMRINLGGDQRASAGDCQLVLLHKCEFLKAMSQPIGESGLYMISVPDADAAMQSGAAKSTDFIAFSGFCAWPAGELERSVSEGMFSVLKDPKTTVPWDHLFHSNNRPITPMDLPLSTVPWTATATNVEPMDEDTVVDRLQSAPLPTSQSELDDLEKLGDRALFEFSKIYLSSEVKASGQE